MFTPLLIVLGLLLVPQVMADSSVMDSGQTAGATQDLAVAWLDLEGTTEPVTYRDVLHEQVSRANFPPKDASPEAKESHFRRMIRLAAIRKILAAQAFHEGLDHKPTIQERITEKQCQLLIQKLRDSVSSKVPVPNDDEIASYYRNHMDQFTLPETFYIQIINSYCPSPEDPHQLDLAREHAKKALAEIEAGSDFARVAVKFSNSPIPYHGGTIAFSPGELNPALEEAARKLRNGERSGLIRGRYGYLIIQRMGYTPAVPQSLEQVLPLLKYRMHKARQDQKWEEYKRAHFTAMKPRLHIDALKQEVIPPQTPLLEFNNREVSCEEIEKRHPDLIKEAMNAPFEKRKEVFDQIMEQELTLEMAKTEGIAELPEVKMELARYLRDLLFHEREQQLLDEMRESTVDPKEVETFYISNKDRLRTQKETRIEILNIPVEQEKRAKGESPSDKEMARSLWLALEARNRILNGESFEMLSKVYSGKDWPWERDFQPQGPRGRIIDMAVESLEKGELSQPIEHGNGYYLIRVVDTHDPHPLTLEEAWLRIEETLQSRKAKEKMEKKYEDLLRNHRFKVNEGYPPVE